jgi:hypothetical protein
MYTVDGAEYHDLTIYTLSRTGDAYGLTTYTVDGNDVHCFTIYTVNEEDSYDLNFMQKCMLSNLLLFDLC